ncbi:hypothetical protein F0249_12015 [Vibrio sp. 03-59-1]|uniref:hypothetical protein n=1 Tax=Vibrio sp. 03-59-1 TaxID=2607607 RepID=UPI001493C830|nr:hypothetical protein [Vibrio sp. 03-59-1]NOH84540.1 hypothetical protein [Vibrio sp. 03-59-1]
MNKSFSITALCLLSFLVLLAYTSSLSVPFYLDDASSIFDNTRVLSGPISDVVTIYGARALTYVTFWANYQVHELSILGYHVVNIAIHLFTGFVVFGLTYSLCCLSLKNKNSKQQVAQYFALFVALIFVIHPLQTQAVTYIVQRTAALVALFYLLSLWCYVLARTASQMKVRIVWFMLCLVTFICALFTKQNSATLPAAIILLELIFISPTWFKNKKVWLTLGVVVAIVTLIGVIQSDQVWNLFERLDRATRETMAITRLEYLDTQLHVVAGYLYTFFWPLHLQLEYDISLQSGDFTQSYAYLALHLGFIVTAILLVKRMPLVAFGVLFYYVAHAVESSIVPIRDLSFEHRTYLPNFGLIVAVSDLLFRGMTILRGSNRRISNEQWSSASILSIVLLSVVLIELTVNRNKLWQNPVAFYVNELVYSENKPRVHNALGQSYMAEEKWELAADSFRDAFFLEFESSIYGFEARYLNNYVAALKNSGEVEKAIQTTLQYIDVAKDRESRSLLMTNLGYMFFQLRNAEKAHLAFDKALKIGKNKAPLESHLGMGLSLWALQRPQEAKPFFLYVIKRDPTHTYAKQLLGQLKQLGY